MKNAIYYKQIWLMPGSRAKELHETWQKTHDEKDRKKLDDHLKDVNNSYNLLSGNSVQRLAR